MSLKTLLGLDAFPITESEIITRIQEAQRKHLQEVEFSTGKDTVKIILREVSRESVMRGDPNSLYGAE